MFKNISKVLFSAIAIGVLATSYSLADCGCQDNAVNYGYPVSQSDVMRAEVKNYDCSAPVPTLAPVYVEQPVMVVSQQPVQPVRKVRHSPASVDFVAYVDNNNENNLRPLSRAEIDRRSKIVTTQENRRVVTRSQKTVSEPEFLMSSRSERQKAFAGEEKTCRDGSIFGGRPCKSATKDGSIFGGGPCVSCSKNGSIFGGGSCVNCSKNGIIFGGGSCKNCSKNGSILGGGTCKNCKKPCQAKKPCQCQAKQPCPCQVSKPCQTAKPCQTCATPAPQPCLQPTPKPECVKKYEVQEAVRKCEDFAPFSMEWVDFRINRDGDSKTYSRNLGNYKFRIFGCRRNAKNTILNEGRIVEKDMNFNEIFTDMVSDCYKVVSTQQCIDENTILPEYVLTAEITDYFMNVCDQYNWDDARMENSRNGSSEITVTWRLMDASKTNVLWKGESKGYAELEEGDYNGEMVLIQRAFADAADNLQYLPGFEEQLSVRVSPEEMERQRKILMEIQKASGICDVKIVEDSGSVSSGFGIADTWVEVKEVPAPKPEPIVEIQTPEVEVPIVTPAPEPVVASAIYEADKLCIVERVDYEDLTDEGGCKVKDSLVLVTNGRGENGVGLLVSEQFVVTSAKFIDRSNNLYTVKTTNGKTIEAKAFRVNPRRNTALLVLSEAADYTPLALAMDLPPVAKGKYVSMGRNVFEAGQNYAGDAVQVSSYRYTEDGIAEIMTTAFAQDVAAGSILVDEKCRVAGLSHRGDKDLFLPIETTIRSLGVEICGKAFPEVKPKPKVWRKPVAAYIDNPEAKAPEAMPQKTRK